MGWDGYHVPTLKNGKIDRKRECDRSNTWDNEESSCEVLKSTMKGSVYYAACRYLNKKTGETEVFGSVCLTQIDNKDYCNFYIKKMTDTMGPCYYDCPISILDLLTPTENEYAKAWRKACRDHMEAKQKRDRLLKSLPIGSIIEFKMEERTIRAEKKAPAYQFKSTWWQVEELSYIHKKNIPNDFIIIREGGVA